MACGNAGDGKAKSRNRTTYETMGMKPITCLLVFTILLGLHRWCEMDFAHPRYVVTAQFLTWCFAAIRFLSFLDLFSFLVFSDRMSISPTS